MTTVAPSNERHSSRTSLRRLAVGTRVSSKLSRNSTPDQEASSGDLSPVSQHSRDSVDTTDMADEEQPLLSRQSDPPPEYSPRASDSDGLTPNRVPIQGYGGTTPGQSYYTFPHTAPATPGEPGLINAEFFAADPKQHRRRRCCCCNPASCWPTHRRVRFLLLMLAAIVSIVLVLWQVIAWALNHYTREPDMIPWYVCEAADTKRLEQFDFDSITSFTLNELLHNDLLFAGDLGGKVKIVGKLPDQHSAVRVNVDLRSSYQTFLEHVSFNQSSDTLTISSPSPNYGRDPFGGERPCTAINVNISVDPRLTDHFEINVPHLSGIEIDPHLTASPNRFFLHVGGNGRIARRAGSKYFQPRHIDISTVDGGIDAALPLVDELWLESINGPITSTATVSSRKDENNVVPRLSNYHANSIGGELRVKVEGTKPRVADLRVQASTVDGSLQGHFVYSSVTNLTTVTGPIQAELSLPVKMIYYNISLLTETMVGHTDLSLVQPTFEGADAALTGLKSRHHSIGGGMRIRYPRQWAGVAKGRTVLGAVDIAGPDVRTTWREGPNIDAVNGGYGYSLMEVESFSGICEVLIDDL